MKDRIRIKDIAIKAGVSTGTVDRVIHDRGNVSPETKKKVQEVMEELGYEPNLMASTLAYNRQFRVAVLLPDFRLDPYWVQPSIGIEKAQQAIRHYGLVVDLHYFDPMKVEDFNETAARVLDSGQPPNAVLFAPLFLNEAQSLLEECRNRDIPNVMINTNVENSDSLCYIGQDSYQSGVLAARLLDFGVNRGDTVLMLNLDKSITNAKHLIDKEKGFRKYWESAKNRHIQIEKHDFENFNDKVELEVFLNDLLDKHARVSGIFVSNSRAYKVVESLPEEALGQIKIVGYDLIDANVRYLRDNKIDFIINQNPVKQGYLGLMNIANHLILKKEVAPLQYLPLDIVVRENLDYYLKKELAFEIVI
jgi:LacI family transcriptional regulator